MIQRICNQTSVLLIGMVVGAVLTAGWQGVWQTPTAHATATHGSDNFAIATGFVDEGIEALYFLDYLTGDLRAAVVNRRTAQFTAFFEHNVMSDFNQLTGPPRFLMVTGRAEIPRGTAATQIGASLIYIAEATSGQVFAYALPFKNWVSVAGQQQRAGFIRVAGGAFRTAFVRDED